LAALALKPAAGLFAQVLKNLLKYAPQAIKTHLLRSENYNNHYMNNDSNHTIHSPLFQGIMNFLGRLRQNPEVYPIKYYKKSKRYRRHWQGPLVK
jgi:fido (protein-threonine AMPylation protein)